MAYDIGKHKWSDSRVFIIESPQDYITLNSDEHLGKLNKNDAIAIAKHFGLIVEVEVTHYTGADLIGCDLANARNLLNDAKVTNDDRMVWDDGLLWKGGVIWSEDEKV